MPVLAEGQDANTLSCKGFTYPTNNGEKTSYDYVGLTGMNGINHSECCCKPYPWSGWIRHIDPAFHTHADAELVDQNNQFNKKWCEEMIDKHKGLGHNAGAFDCSGPCTQDD